MTSSWHGRVSVQEGRSPLHDIANSGRHRNGYCGADFNYPQGENSLSFFQTVEVGLTTATSQSQPTPDEQYQTAQQYLTVPWTVGQKNATRPEYI